MKTNALRKSFLDFFSAQKHPIVASDSLVPQNDPSLLFTGAGMNQFKDNFLGVKKNLARATSSQKCLRTGDLENVGKTPYHHTFFEMLGNFSFGDYFKEEAISWAWEFLTVVLKMSPERLRISIHKTDDEAFLIWNKKIGIREDWIYRLGDKSNFWPANAPSDGPNGPCGPCSEIYYDQDPGSGDNDLEGRRFAEIWNLVFTQFDRREGGTLVPLAQKNIDTGMGLERLACMMQGKKSNFEIDLFTPIHAETQKLLKIQATPAQLSSLYTIADHARAVTFSIADGVVPSNEGRGYVIRKLIRRALWHAYQLKQTRLEKTFLNQMVPAVAEAMKAAYPEISEAAESIASTIRSEEERFLTTLENGLSRLDQILEQQENAGQKSLAGEVVFELYDTFGFPDELTRTIAESRGYTIDQTGFDKQMELQRKRAKDASQISSEIFATSDLERKLAALPSTRFLGYTQLEAKGTVLLAQIENEKGVIVLDQTPFYAESGGQTGDRGTLEGKNFKAAVIDTQKKDGVFLHVLQILSGSIQAGDELQAQVDQEGRAAVMRNHTATHLLHAALRQTLGKQVRQLGSLVSPEKLRFDYSYGQALNRTQLETIEDIVNHEILQNSRVTKEEKSLEEAKQSGALAFFGEKYGEKVRMISVSEFSRELCGGTHCDATGQIGAFVILSDSSIASGTRRIEALTGEGALAYFKKLRSQTVEVAERLKTAPMDILSRVEKLQETVKKLEKEKDKQISKSLDPSKIIAAAQPMGKYQFLFHKEKDIEAQSLRTISDTLRTGTSQTIYFLAAEKQDKIQFLIGLSQDLMKSGFDVRPLGKKLGEIISANTGGSAHLVQGGCQNQNQLTEKKERLISEAEVYLKQS